MPRVNEDGFGVVVGFVEDGARPDGVLLDGAARAFGGRRGGSGLQCPVSGQHAEGGQFLPFTLGKLAVQSVLKACRPGYGHWHGASLQVFTLA